MIILGRVCLMNLSDRLREEVLVLAAITAPFFLTFCVTSSHLPERNVALSETNL